jgi:chromosome segregation ATPase
MIKQCVCSKTSNAYQQELDALVKDPRQVELYLEEHIRSGDAELAMIVMRDIIEAERRKFSDRLDALEKRADEIEKRIEALEQVQVTRQEFDEVKARVEGLEDVQKQSFPGIILYLPQKEGND